MKIELALKTDLQIIKLVPNDIKQKSDRYFQFLDLILKHEDMYPGIDKWVFNKVLNGIINDSRIAYLGFIDGVPIVSSIVKKGKHSKFCHLNIDEKYRNNNVGDLFFAMMALDVKSNAKEIHFTLPENLWEEKKEFFMSFGFTTANLSPIQYRKSQEELKCTSSFPIVWQNVLLKLPSILDSFQSSKQNIFNSLIMSIKPEYLEKIKNGDKVIELRKKFHSKWKGFKVTLYSSSPTKALIGYATIKTVEKDTPSNIWEKYSSDIGCNYNQFNDYVSDTNELYAIVLQDYESYKYPLYLTQIRHLLNKDIFPPQSYSSLNSDKKWAEAVSIAELLHGRFSIFNQFV